VIYTIKIPVLTGVFGKHGYLTLPGGGGTVDVANANALVDA
jgi:hypothetical protein